MPAACDFAAKTSQGEECEINLEYVEEPAQDNAVLVRHDISRRRRKDEKKRQKKLVQKLWSAVYKGYGRDIVDVISTVPRLIDLDNPEGGIEGADPNATAPDLTEWIREPGPRQRGRRRGTKGHSKVLLGNDEFTPLVYAAREGKEGVVLALLRSERTDVNLPDFSGWRAIHHAANSNMKRVVELLVADPRVDVNITTNAGLTALQIAAAQGNRGTVKKLLGNPSVDTSLRDPNGRSALDWARIYKDSVLIYKDSEDPEEQELFEKALDTEKFVTSQGSADVLPLQMMFVEDAQARVFERMKVVSQRFEWKTGIKVSPPDRWPEPVKNQAP